MTSTQQTLWLFGGVFALLVFASTIGWLLQWRYAARAHATHPGIENLNARIKAWWVIVGLIGLAFLFGRIGVIVLFGLVSFFALREFITLTPTRRGDHVALSVAFFLVLPEQYVLVAMGWYGMFSIFIPVYVFLLLPIIAALSSDTTHFLERGADSMGTHDLRILRQPRAGSADARHPIL